MGDSLLLSRPKKSCNIADERVVRRQRIGPTFEGIGDRGLQTCADSVMVWSEASIALPELDHWREAQKCTGRWIRREAPKRAPASWRRLPSPSARSRGLRGPGTSAAGPADASELRGLGYGRKAMTVPLFDPTNATLLSVAMLVRCPI
jgi:hypothetical protein